jgi:hypothetical protein
MRIAKAEQTYRPLRGAAALAALTLASLSAGCSSGIFGSASDPAASSASASASSPSMTSRVTDFFAPPKLQHVPTDDSAKLATETCPPVDVRLGASTLTIPPGSADAFSLRYQGTIGEMARECKVANGIMRMRVGVQGRVLVGPAGGGGKIDVPMRYAVVKEGPEPKTVVSKFYKVAVTIPDGQPNVAFTHIDDDVAFPLPSDGDIDAYVVYVGFDPIGEKQQPAKKPAAKPAAKPVAARPR